MTFNSAQHLRAHRPEFHERPLPVTTELSPSTDLATFHPDAPRATDLAIRPDQSSGITGFEVLAEPRAVTAKAVLDRVRGHVEARGEDPDHEMFGLAAIAREFGVSP